VLHFKKGRGESTSIRLIKSHYDDPRFLNIFSDNEARLFFSKFILFVEGETELEVFGNLKLISKFDKLRDIDVYAANDVHLNAIGPSKSNLPIPFLILYDSDHFLDCNLEKVGDKTLAKLSNDIKRKVRLDKIEKGLRCSFYGSKDYKVRRAIGEIKRVISSAKGLNEHQTDYSAFKLGYFINFANRNIFKSQNIRFNETTIEGVLINIESLRYFIDWVIYEVTNNLNVTPNSNVVAKVMGIQTKYISTGDVKTAFSALFSTCSSNESIPKTLENFTKIVKIKYLKIIRDEIKNSGFSNQDIVMALKLTFGGKTNTLVKIENKKYQTIVSQEMRRFVKKIKEEYFANFTYGTSKTSGWASSFIDYTIERIEQESAADEKKFYTKFAVVFPELDDIIKKVSF
jgi:hypothetical protein